MRMARRRRPLRAVSLVFAGFVTLVVLSQLSSHFFAAAIPRGLVTKNEAVLAGIHNTSDDMALAASVLGTVFAGAVLVITRERVSADVDIYRATGLPPLAAFLRVVRSHSAPQLAWVAIATAAASLVDAAFGLDALVPVGLAASFALLLVSWMAFLTSVSFSHRGVAAAGGRVG